MACETSVIRVNWSRSKEAPNKRFACGMRFMRQQIFCARKAPLFGALFFIRPWLEMSMRDIVRALAAAA